MRVVPEDDMVAALVEEAEKLVAEGIEARLAAADSGRPSRSRGGPRALLEAQGRDANHDAEQVELIRKTIDDGTNRPRPA